MVIDADAHVVETEHTWDYLDESDRKFRPQLYQSSENPNAQCWFLDGKVIGFRNPTLTEQELNALSEQTGRSLQTPQQAREARDVELRLRHMDNLGIDIQVLHNTLWIARVADRPDAEIALCMAWNRWMADVWKQANGRLYWSCVVPAMTIGEALQQIRFAREHGAVAVCLRPFETERQLADPYFYPIYQEAMRLNMAMAIHIANASPQLLEQMRPRYDRMGGFAQFRVPAVVTCLSLMMSEIPQLFPALRWGFIESSSQWVPWVVNEAVRRSGTRSFPRKPLKEFKIYVTAQTDDDFAFVIKYAGEDNLVIGTDYGHTDASSQVDAISVFRRNNDIDERVKNKILDDNPRALYAM
jgi:predicted TIM-barrel fold metal-dependent hydrolase